MNPPTPTEILAARRGAELSQVEAARVIWTGPRTWQRYESGSTAMHPGLYELFCLKTNQPHRLPR